MMIKVLNLYAGLGGNRKDWKNVIVTAIEQCPKIAKVYADNNPNDKVIVGEAHEYLREHYHEFDFIWSSPPCQSHSRFIRCGRNRQPKYPDLKLYEEIIFLQSNFKGLYVIENVIPYYDPLLPAQKIGRHLFWANFNISPITVHSPKGFIKKDDPAALKEWMGISYTGNIYYGNNHSPAQVLRNCVHPHVGLHILNCAVNHNNNYRKTSHSIFTKKHYR